MVADVRYVSWFAGGGGLRTDLPASPVTLAYEGFALVASAVGHDCQDHALARVGRAAASASEVYGHVAGEAVRDLLELVYQPERPIDPRPLLRIPNGLLALRHAVACVYTELDGGTFGLTAEPAST